MLELLHFPKQDCRCGVDVCEEECLSFNPAQFHRSTMTKTGVLQSVCIQCGRVVAFSSFPRALELADRAHVCVVIASAEGELSRGHKSARCSGC